MSGYAYAHYFKSYNGGEYTNGVIYANGFTNETYYHNDSGTHFTYSISNFDGYGGYNINTRYDGSTKHYYFSKSYSNMQSDMSYTFYGDNSTGESSSIYTNGAYSTSNYSPPNLGYGGYYHGGYYSGGYYYGGYYSGYYYGDGYYGGGYYGGGYYTGGYYYGTPSYYYSYGSYTYSYYMSSGGGTIFHYT